MFKFIKQLYRKLSPIEIAIRELEEAQLQALSANTAMEYYKSMVAYNDSRILRLKAFIKFPG